MCTRLADVYTGKCFETSHLFLYILEVTSFGGIPAKTQTTNIMFLDIIHRPVFI
jgi:hypothetical protein